MAGRRPLPTADGWQRQRAAASRNEDAILRAAAQLFAREGVEAVDVRGVAAEAGVGVGTVYRRFVNKASLMAAVIGAQEQELQDALLHGPPPLGPGAPPQARLEAFLGALSELTERNMDVIAASEAAAGGDRDRIGSYRAWRLHLTVLLGELGTKQDPEWLAELLLAPLAGAVYRRQRRAGISADRIAENLLHASRQLTAAAQVS
jgi:AcrR family transcriptional regulator